MRKIGLIFKNDVYRVIDEAFEYLESQQNTDNGTSGWHQFLESGKIGNVATAQILILYKYFDKQIPALESCLTSFKTNRKDIMWQNEKISGWSYVTSGPLVPCIEPTCWVCLAYQTLSLRESHKIELDVHTFLRGTRIVSPAGSSWGFTPWTEGRVSPTCIALRVLSRIGDQKLVDEAIRWLLAARDSQNAWGQASKSTATITHTSFAILALREAGYAPKNPVLLNAYSFLANRLQKWLTAKQPWVSLGSNISGFSEIVEVPALPKLVHQPTRIQYYYNPIMLSAIALSTDLETYLPYVEAVAIQATKDWDAMRWKHPWLKEHEHVTSWSFYDHMLAMEPICRVWSDDRKSGSIYFFSSHGPMLLRIGRGSNILRFVRRQSISFFLRVIVSTVVLILFAYFILDTMDLKAVVITVILGVISNIVYAYFKS